MERILWLFDNRSEKGLWVACLASILLHCIMIAIMATTTVFFPLTGENPKLDIVWLYPSFLLGGDAEPVSAPSPAPREKQAPSPQASEPRQSATPPQEPAEDADDTERAEPVRQPSPPPPEAPAAEPEVVAAVPEIEEPETEPEMTLPPEPPQKTTTKPEPPAPVPVTVKPEARKEIVTPPAVPAKKAEIKPVEKEPVRVTPPQETPPPVKQEKTVAKEVRPPPAKTEVPAPEIKKPAPVPVSVPRPSVAQAERPRESAPVSASKVVASEKQTPSSNAAAKPALSPAEPPSLPVKKESGSGSAIVQKKVEPTPVVKTVSKDKPSEDGSGKTGGVKGIMAPPLIGDLKLVITAPPDVLKGLKISVFFCEYPKTRHNRPMPKGDARRVQTLTPVMAKQSENSIAAVVESAREGIYEFRNVTETASAATADFKLRIYESSPRAQVKSVGSRKISDKRSIAKIMMPEGILWDDETAFSGSMEDSESITRFNSDTGLVWKEYRQ